MLGLMQDWPLLCHRIEQQQTCLAGNRYPDLIGDGQAITSDKLFLVQKLFYQALELQLKIRRHSGKGRHILAQNLRVMTRKRARNGTLQAIFRKPEQQPAPEYQHHHQQGERH